VFAVYDRCGRRAGGRVSCPSEGIILCWKRCTIAKIAPDELRSQMLSIGGAADVALAISTSGNSPNAVEAVFARAE
jgi:hypothetical protein